MTAKHEFVTLPDYLEVGLDLVFVGINPGLFSVRQGHYFARASSRFWPALSASKLSAEIRRSLGCALLRPEHDQVLSQFGIGFTDVIKRPSANAGELSPEEFERWSPLLLEKLQMYAPRVACFHGLTGFRPFLKYALKCLNRNPALGPQPERVGPVRLYVVPNPSPANAHFTVADQTAWYNRLADFVARMKQSGIRSRA
ncbi:MAG: mismatch-specific DNA-glycosylase [Actinomycetota bacterium]